MRVSFASETDSVSPVIVSPVHVYLLYSRNMFHKNKDIISAPYYYEHTHVKAKTVYLLCALLYVLCPCMYFGLQRGVSTAAGLGSG